MGCACIKVSSKLVIKANKILSNKINTDTENSNVPINPSVNINKDIDPYIWLTIIDFLDFKDLKETRQINR